MDKEKLPCRGRPAAQLFVKATSRFGVIVKEFEDIGLPLWDA